MNFTTTYRRSLWMIGTGLALLLASAVATSAGEVPRPLDFSKLFAPDQIGPGSTTVLRLDITNASGVQAESLAFTDVLPAGVVIATPASASTDCSNGILSAPDGGTTISLSGARLSVGASCSVTVNVTAGAIRSYDNLSGELTSTAGSGGTAAATLVVDGGRPGFSKSFAPNPIAPGGTSTLTFLIDNTGNKSSAGDLGFDDVLPSGLAFAFPLNATNTCGGGLVAGLSGDGLSQVVSLTDGFVAASSSCTVAVDVTAAGDGSFLNTSGELSGLAGGEVDFASGFATAQLDVEAQFLSKLFTDDPVPPGGTVTLEFTINNPSRDFPATNIAFSDNLGAVLPGLLAIGLPAGECGGTVSTPDSGVTIAFSGGSLPAGGSCTFGVSLTVPASATEGGYSNTTTAITATIEGKGVEGGAAVDKLFVSEAPVLTKSFIDDPVGAGGTVTLEFTLVNVSDSTVSEIGFEDEFDVILPTASEVAGVVVTNKALPTVATAFCNGTGSATFTPLVNPAPPASVVPATLVVSDAGLAPGASCTFSIVLDVSTGAPAGSYPNTTSLVTALVGTCERATEGVDPDGGPLGAEVFCQPVIGRSASDDLAVVAGPRLTKEFTDDPVQPGDTVTLEFTLEHDALAPGDATAIAFTDNLAAVISGLAATGLPLTDVCGPGNGTLTGTAMNTALNFSGATLAPSEICTFSVTLNVPGTAPAGTHVNTTSNVLATVLGLATIEEPAEADLTVGGLFLLKSFVDDPVIAGGTVNLEFTIVNLRPLAATDISFEDPLDPDVLLGLRVSGPLPTDPCGPGSVLETFSGGSPTVTEGLRLSGGSLAAGSGIEGSASCTFAVELMVPGATVSGVYDNRTRGFSATLDGTTFPFPDAVDRLTVANEQLLLTKEFTGDPVAPGDTVTLEFSLNSLGAAFDAVDDIAFTDDLDAALPGLVAVPPLDTGTCGGALTGTSLLDFSGGSFIGGECSFSVTLQVPAPLPIGTTATNTTSPVTGTIVGLPVTGGPAEDILLINSFEFSKAFDGPAVPSGTVGLTFTIKNLSATASVTALGFTDDLGGMGIPGVVATGLPVEPCGPESSITGTSLLTFSAGNLLPGGSCTFSVVLLMPPNAPGGSFHNATSDLETSGLPVATPAEADLTVVAPPVFAKIFDPQMVGEGFDTTLTFSIFNTSTSPATGLVFTDILPFDLLVAEEPAVANTCGGTVAAIPFDTTIALTGGIVGASASCEISVRVFAPTSRVVTNTTGDLTSSLGNSGEASARLTVVPCGAPNGANLTLGDAPGGAVLTEETYSVCNTIQVKQHTLVLGPNGRLILRAGVAVVFFDGFSVEQLGELVVEIDPTLIP